MSHYRKLFIIAILFCTSAIGYERKCELVIQESQLHDSGSYTDFIVLFTEDNLPTDTNEMFDADGSYPALSSGNDLEFWSDSDLTTEITAVEVVSFSTDNTPTNGTAQIYVKCSPTANSNTSIWVSWDGSTDNSGGRTNPWGDYLAVYHCEDASGTLTDSTANGHDLTAVGTPVYQATGKVGDGVTLDGSTEYFYKTGLSIDTSSPVNFYISAWSSKANPRGYLAAIVDNDQAAVGLGLRAETDDTVDWLAVGGSWNATPVNTYTESSYFHVAGAFDDDTNSATSVIDGDLANAGSDTGATNSTTMTGMSVGCFYRDAGQGGPLNLLEGTIDEIRLALFTRDDYWKQAEYNNLNAPGSFVTEGTPEAVGPTERYADFDLATGLNDGTSEANAWQSWGDIVFAAGERVNIQAGASAHSIGSVTQTTNGTAGSPVYLRGYTTTIGDGGLWEFTGDITWSGDYGYIDDVDGQIIVDSTVSTGGPVRRLGGLIAR